MAEKIKPYLFYTIMYPSVTKDKAVVMDQLLNVFDKYDKFVPTQWGDSEVTTIDYNRSEILEKVMNNKTSEVYLHRSNAVKFTAQFDLDLNIRSILTLRFINRCQANFGLQLFHGKLTNSVFIDG
ncbi:hypothetical protein YSY43_21690 [Paenibacillus sp. YSY-4.3]